MAVAYIIAAVLILILNYKAIPGAVVEIVQSAFGMRAVAGGALGAMMLAMQKGIARGIFSNEAGIGSAPIAAAAVQTTEPVRQGLGFPLSLPEAGTRDLKVLLLQQEHSRLDFLSLQKYPPLS